MLGQSDRHCFSNTGCCWCCCVSFTVTVSAILVVTDAVVSVLLSLFQQSWLLLMLLCQSYCHCFGNTGGYWYCWVKLTVTVSAVRVVTDAVGSGWVTVSATLVVTKAVGSIWLPLFQQYWLLLMLLGQSESPFRQHWWLLMLLGQSDCCCFSSAGSYWYCFQQHW